MQICHSAAARAISPNAGIATVLDAVSETYLREVVNTVSIPRHYREEPDNNRRIAAWIVNRLQSYGYHTSYEGEYANVVALPATAHGAEAHEADLILIGAHYDSVPGTPGADDNASAIAALLGCAQAVVEAGIHDSVQKSVCFVAFNREEDGLLGSRDFVADHLSRGALKIRQAHVLEMVGYCSHSPESQHLPPGLPIKVSDVGDFLGLIANKDSIDLLDDVLVYAKSYLPAFPVTGLKVPMGLEKYFPPLERSDHVPFWRAGIPALMWTDTSEFRNPHYHQSSDLPATLDYTFLRRVTQLLIAQVLSHISASFLIEKGAQK
jgi:Zn-dependent M28 family amino/carboxypeptidase